MTDEFDPTALNAHQKALLAQTNDFQKRWFEKELNPEQKAEVMALHTGMTPEGDRPLLRRPEPDYVSSDNMIDILWRRSAWAPIDEMVSFEYAIQSDPEMMNFEDWIKVSLEKGYLRAYARIDDGPYQDAEIDNPGDPDIFIALSKRLEVPCNVRRVGDSFVFPNLAPMDPVKCQLWFIRDDVDNLPVQAKAVDIGSTTRFGKVEIRADPHVDVPVDAPATERSVNPNVGREPKYVWFVNELWRTCVCPENHPVPVTDRELLKITRKRLKNDHRPLPADAPVYARSVMDAFKGLPS